LLDPDSTGLSPPGIWGGRYCTVRVIERKDTRLDVRPVGHRV
jgi:hypothetical protein